MQGFRLLQIALVAPIIALTACSQLSTVQSKSNLTSALAFVPGNVNDVFFTDWSSLKTHKGVPDLTSKSDIAKRREFMLSLSRDMAAASAFGVRNFETHAEVWSWDSADLVWEASIATQVPAFVLKFRNDFNFAQVLARFEQRGFRKSNYLGKTIYSHDLDPTADWLRATEFAILNTAILPDEKVFVLSSSADSVHAILEEQQGKSNSLRDAKAIQSVAQQIGDVAAAYLRPGAQACERLDAAPLLLSGRLTAEQSARLKELVSQSSQLHSFNALGIGYRYEAGKPVGLIVMHYANAADAQSDLETRKLLADQGTSLVAQVPYSQATFTLDKASVEGSDLVLQVTPVGNAPRRLFQIVFQRDMLFALCP